MKTQILKMLRSSSEYTSGQSICNTLGVSRTAVWKYINQLKEDGYVIDALQNKGYHISEYPDVMTEVELGSLFENEFIGSEIHFYDQIDSTNNEARKIAENGAQHGTLVITECQNGGRGRRGKTWISPSGSGIWMSIILRPEMEPYNASMLTLIAALAATSAIRKCCGTECYIKWPNDIVLNGKKICGILTEMSAEPDAVNYVVIGIGINVNTTEFDEEIKAVASSLFAETGQKIKRSMLVAAFATEFEKYYDIFIQTQDMSHLVEEYNSMLINAGKEVTITDSKGAFSGIAIGTDNKGQLIVTCEDGSVKNIIAGEVSVRGLYGYV